MPPIETESSTGASSGRPGVSVSEAFNIPQDWTLATALRGVGGDKKDISVQPEKPEGTPDPDQMEREAGKKTVPEEGSVEADRQEAAAAEAARKEREAKPAASAAKPVDKPAAGAAAAKPVAKAGVKPAAGAAAKPATKPAAPAADPEAAEEKVTIGGKEYTKPELEALLAGKPAAKPATEAPAAPAAPAKTKEEQDAETAARAEEEKRQDENWIAQTVAKIEAPLDEKTLDTILTGGKDAVAALQEIRKRDMATTILNTRKDIYRELQPVIQAVDRINAERMSAEDTRIENEMVAQHPHLDTPQLRQLSRTIAAEMVKQPGFKVKDLNEFKDMVAAQTTEYVRQFNPQFGTNSPAGGDDGGAAAAAAPAAPAATPAAKPAAGAPAAGARRRSPPPPSGHVPGTAAAGGGRDRGFQKSAIESLM